MAAIETLLPRIRTRTPGAAEFLRTEELVTAVREFCRATRVWRETIQLSIEAGEQWYELVPMTPDAEVVGVYAATYHGCALQTAAPEQLPQREGPRPEAFWYAPPATLSLTPTPQLDEVGAVVVTAYLQPTLDTLGVPDIVAQQWPEALVDGALAALLDIPGAPWENSNLSQRYRRNFEAGMSRARTDADLNYRTWGLRTRSHGGW